MRTEQENLKLLVKNVRQEQRRNVNKQQQRAANDEHSPYEAGYENHEKQRMATMIGHIAIAASKIKNLEARLKSRRESEDGKSEIFLRKLEDANLEKAALQRQMLSQLEEYRAAIGQEAAAKEWKTAAKEREAAAKQREATAREQELVAAMEKQRSAFGEVANRNAKQDDAITQNRFISKNLFRKCYCVNLR